MKKIDLTPKWSDILPDMVRALLRHTRHEQLSDLIEEFKRMAEAADLWNEHCKKQKGGSK